jgi:xanthine dehydrogenase large subunit
VLTASDIPGPNDCGPIVHDDPILADGVVQYVGQPMFAVVAETNDVARRAARLAKVDYEVLPGGADAAGSEENRSRTCCRRCTLQRGDAGRGDGAAQRPHGRRRSTSGGQEQFYLEGPDLVRGAEGGRLHPPLLLDAAPDGDAARRCATRSSSSRTR